MDRVIQIRIQESQAGARIDRLIASEVADLSRAAVQRLIKDERLTVNARTTRASYRVGSGDLVTLHVPSPQAIEIYPESLPLQVLHEDASLIVVDKPAGMVTHPAHGHTTGTLVNALLAYCPALTTMPDRERAGLVHRLDKDTSGVIVVAKTEAARQALQAQFKARAVHKTYLALIEGHPEPAAGRIDAPIGRDAQHRKRMAVIHEGRQAITDYRVLEHFDEHSLVQAAPHTGRTHQIRVHMAFIGHPIVGDRVYGYRRQRLPLNRHFLHATHITLTHPATGQMVEFHSELPGDLSALLDRLRAQTSRL
ncbi:MAG: RluA family pseudouridine synthase [Chloroflexota bacterium]